MMEQTCRITLVGEWPTVQWGWGAKNHGQGLIRGDEEGKAKTAIVKL